MYTSMNKLTMLFTFSLVIALAAFISPTAAKAQAVNSTTNLLELRFNSSIAAALHD